MEFKRKNSIFIRVSILMFLSIFIFAGCGNGEEGVADDVTYMKDIDYTSAVIEKNNNIYIYDENYQYLDLIGESSRIKELSVLNVKSKEIAFKYMDENSKVNIYNIANRESKVLDIGEEGEISYIQWFQDVLVVGIYENPTTNKYLIYNSETLELINSCKGILIDVFDEGKTVVYGYNIQGITSIYINDDIIYSLENAGEVLLDGKVSPDKNEIALLTFVFNAETFQQEEKLYIGELKENKLKKVEVINKPYEIHGIIKYDNDKLVILNEDEYTEIVDGEFVTLKLVETNNSLKENTAKLKKILKDTFKSEVIEEDKSFMDNGVKSITWFAR